ncbi:MAG: metalloendopeptidase [Candidatus Rifleibacterium amylolyticum]|nr:MAG: metalloendopeptidase [Candidatus Rifleibacterium amylolyticum]
MRNHDSKKISNSCRALLIFLSLILLQMSAPQSESSAFNLSAAFYQPVETKINFWKPLKQVFAAASESADEMRAMIPEKLPAKTFRIVSVSSKKVTPASRLWPVRGSISSAFGMRRHPVTKKRSFHNGIDIRAKIGTSIVCPADGIVVSAGHAGLLGRLVKVRTGEGKTLYFGHMHKIKCVKGQRVKRGTIVGTVGRSGRATGPHLHFSVLSGGRYLDPTKYLSTK